MRFYILFFCSVPLRRESQGVPGWTSVIQTTSTHRMLQINFEATSTFGETPEVLLPSMWSSSVTNRIREQITFPNAKRNPICSPALLEKKLPQESKGKINVLIWQNLLQWIITLSFNCKHGYYCDRVATQKKVTEEVQSSCHCLTKSIFCKYIHIYSL